MSKAATATAAAPPDAAPSKVAGGKKKLLLMVGIAVLVLAIAGGGAAFFMMKQRAKAAAEAADDPEAARAAAHKKHDEAHAPTFLPLDPFVVNLADRGADRFAQIGITLEVTDAKAAERLRQYMPAIRNGILMVIAHKTSADLLERSGKEQLAEEVLVEAVRPLGYEPREALQLLRAQSAEPDDAQDGKESKDSKGKKDADPLPVKAVNFSSFIIQ